MKFKIDNLYYRVINEGEVEVSPQKNVYPDWEEECKPKGHLSIPKVVTYCKNEYNVVGIGHSAFSGCDKLSSLVIPGSVTYIGEMAFFDCSNLTGSLTIPISVTKIGDYAFSFCSGLTERLTIPNSVTDIGKSAFSYCQGFTSLTISDSVSRVKENTFSQCSGLLGSLTIPDRVKSIDSRAFEGCSGLTGALTIPNSVKCIKAFAFLDCTNISTVISRIEYPNNVKICSEVFGGTKVNKGLLVVPKGKVNAYKHNSKWSGMFSNIIEG